MDDRDASFCMKWKCVERDDDKQHFPLHMVNYVNNVACGGETVVKRACPLPIIKYMESYGKM